MAGTNPKHLERMPLRPTRTIVVATALALALAIPATAFAGKGGGSSTSPAWIALATVSGQSVAAAEPRVGASVKFNSGYPTTTKNAWVSLTCYQDGVLVYGEGGAPTKEFVLGGASSDWQRAGGPAACRAELGDLYWRGGKQYYSYLAHTDFHAAE